MCPHSAAEIQVAEPDQQQRRAETMAYTNGEVIAYGTHSTIHKPSKKLAESSDPICFKVPGDSLTDIQKIKFEINLLGRLQHTHVVALHCLGSVPSTILPMKYYPQTLHGVIKTRKLPPGYNWPSFCGDAAYGLADALSYIHSEGIAHMDMKSANILVGRDGAIKLCDFGLAICLKNDRGVLQVIHVNAPRGAAFYRAPELTAASPSNRVRVSRRSDIYSLGVIFWELMCQCVVSEHSMHRDWIKREELTREKTVVFALIQSMSTELCARPRAASIKAFIQGIGQQTLFSTGGKSNLSDVTIAEPSPSAKQLLFHLRETVKSPRAICLPVSLRVTGE